MTPLLVIQGATASGKTGLAVAVARELDGEIISADSRQFYHGMDLGTGKDLEEYNLGGAAVPYHLIDIASPAHPLNIQDYFKHYAVALRQVMDAGKLPVLCGGSGLYVETALGRHPLAAIPIDQALRDTLLALEKAELLRRFEGLPEALKKRLDGSTVKRLVRGLEIGEYLASNPEPTLALPATRPVFVALEIPREKRRQRISERLRQRFDVGMLAEVEGLIEQGISPERLRYFGLEYQCMVDHLEGKTSFDEMFARLETDIHRFAKRQMTWLRRMEKKGDVLNWLPFDMPREQQVKQVRAWLKS